MNSRVPLGLSLGIAIVALVATVMLTRVAPTEPFVMRALNPTTLNQGKIITSDDGGSLGTVSVYDMAFPPRTILMWNDVEKDTEPPVGWVLCDGRTVQVNNQSVTTPDLRYRFPVGLDTADADFDLLTDKSSDSSPPDTIMLTVAQIPSHTHTYTTLKRDANNANVDTDTEVACALNQDWKENGFTTGANVAETRPHNNMPPYIVVKFIMKL